MTENYALQPELCDAPPGSAEASGVVALHVDSGAAARCAAYLHAHWHDGRLAMPGGRSCHGYALYGKTLSEHDAAQQAANTLLIANSQLAAVRAHVPGFEEMERELAHWVQVRYGTVVDLFYAHGLRQSPETLSSTGFAVHQDTEDYDFIEYTVVVKLTPDALDEPPSAMRVIGAAEHFHYGAAAGAAGAFRARLHHASVAPESPREHLKIAFFFRKSGKAARRVQKRARH